jgi:hypothetical protein
MLQPQLVVMAAGIGSRFGGVKQMEPVGPGGETITDYALYDARRAGFERVVFIVRKDIEVPFRERIGLEAEKHFAVLYALQDIADLPPGFSPPHERKKPWGTAHAVLCAADAIDAPFAVVNADDFYGAGSFRALHSYLTRASDRNGYYDYCMVAYRLINTLSEHGHVSRGICRPTPEGDLDTIVERTRILGFDGAARYEAENGNWIDIPPDSLVSMNMFGFTPSFIAELQSRFPAFLRENVGEPKAEFFLPGVVNGLIEEKKARVRILPTQDRWMGVTYREDTPAVREAIRALIAQGVYPDRLWAGV